MVNKAFGEIAGTGKLKLFKSYKQEFKDGEQKRDFIYVKDAVEMTVFFDNSNQVGSKVNGLFNIGSGKASTWLDMAYALFKAIGKEPEIEFIEMPDNIKNQYQYYTRAEVSKLYNSGYNKPVMSLDNSVRDYVVNYLMKSEYLKSNN
jgi:ADP-L-glycero-D-manno-heptose 6-epimerase